MVQGMEVMTDLVVIRLREYVENIRGKDEPPENYLCWQAADEIERLRQQVKLLHQLLDREAAWPGKEA